jgi:hypothetical protein
MHELLLIKALRLMSDFDDNLFIFFCGVSPTHLIHPPPPLALNAASLNYTCSRVGAGQQKDKIPFRRLSQQMSMDK